ncbi:hypothetical protein H0W26_00470 [Candidatus Dependentiae bacterium]|nr:hypothetical protein [Candidatus Dependentiae bacterium]
MKIINPTEHQKGKYEHHDHVNAKHLQDNAKKLAQKQPRGNFFGTHRWFPYNINEQ